MVIRILEGGSCYMKDIGANYMAIGGYAYTTDVTTVQGTR